MKFSPKLEQYRISTGLFATFPNEPMGAFMISGPYHRTLNVIASAGDDDLGVPWEHVSVSTRGRCPNWEEMCFIKDLFWDEEEMVMQVHPPKSEWINNHKFCLHLWKPKYEKIPAPPGVAVGDKKMNDDPEGMKKAVENLKKEISQSGQA